jgi:RNA polymerase sigma factor for flagellar operon FliA
MPERERKCRPARIELDAALAAVIVSLRIVQPPREAPDSPEILARFDAELDLVDLLARQVGRSIGTSTVTLDDLRSFGREGLLQAARTFDASRGVPFRRWANLRIRGAMIDGVRQWGTLPRRVYRELRGLEAADRLQESYDEEDAANPAASAEAADGRLTAYLAGIATAIAVGTMIAAPRDIVDAEGHDLTPEDLVSNAQLVARVKEIVARLPDAERTLVERHYFGDETIDQAAASIGLSKSWGSRLHARAIDSIARQLRSQEPREQGE